MKWKSLLTRLLTALGVGVLVAGAAYTCAWFEYRGYYLYNYTSYLTQLEMDRLCALIERHRTKTGRLPDTLEVLAADPQDGVHLNDGGRVSDYWGHPLVYHVEGEAYTLYSLGRDGRPWGEGLDADVYPQAAGRPRQALTLWQFTFDSGTGGIQQTCALAGVCAGLLCVPNPRKWRDDPPRRKEYLIRVAITAAAAVVTAVVISFLHLPSGH